MSEYTPASERTIYSGMCSDPDCMTSMAIWPHWERPTDLPENDEWEDGGIFLGCPVCGSTMDLDFTDSMTTHIRTGYADYEFKETPMTKRTTDDWEALLDPDFSERMWVEEPDQDDEDWHVCFRDPYWGFRATIGSTHDGKLAKLFAASYEAVAEVVRLRKAIDELAHGAYVMASQHYYMGGERYDELGSTEQSYYEDLTRILEGEQR